MQNRDQYFCNFSDEDLVTLAQEGTSGAFVELVQRHYSNWKNLAVSIVGELSDAEDELQNAICKAFEHIKQFHQDSKFSTWMTRIVVNQCLMRLRKVRRSRQVFFDDLRLDQDAAPVQIPSADLDAERQLASRQVSAVLKTEIRRIPPLLRNVFLLRDVEQLPMEEVARRLGVTIPAAKSRLLRARSELKQRLMRHCGRVGPATLFI